MAAQDFRHRSCFHISLGVFARVCISNAQFSCGYLLVSIKCIYMATASGYSQRIMVNQVCATQCYGKGMLHHGLCALHGKTCY